MSRTDLTKHFRQARRLPPRGNWRETRPDHYEDYLHFRVPARLMRVGIAQVTAALQDAGFLPRRMTCECSHCRNDRDCCGMIFPYALKVSRARRGVKAVIFHTRNI